MDVCTEHHGGVPPHLLHMPTEVILRMGGARGGLLCDEPGLGKTITVLSRMLQTAGLRTHIHRMTRAERASAAATQWRNYPDPIHQRMGLLKVLSNLRRLDKGAHYSWFSAPVDLEAFPDYQSVVSEPMDFQTITWRISGSHGEQQYSELGSFVRDCRRVFSNAIMYTQDPAAPIVASVHKLMQAFEDAMDELYASLLRTNRSAADVSTASVSMLRGRFASKHAARDAKAAGDSSLLLESNATLVVVPVPLIDHWRKQIQMHVDFEFLKASFAHLAGNGSDGPVPSDLVWIDPGRGDLPDPAFMSSRWCIVISMTRLSTENRNNGLHSALRQIRWLRVVVDEGHSLGGKALSDYGNMLRSLDAERRWMMSGTPIKGATAHDLKQSLTGLNSTATPTATASGCSSSTSQSANDQPAQGAESWTLAWFNQVVGFLSFIKHTPYGANSSIFRERIVRPCLKGDDAALQELSRLLTGNAAQDEDAPSQTVVRRYGSKVRYTLGIMIQHDKESVARHLPQPIRRTVVLQMSEAERRSYNTIVAFARANMVLTTMPGGKPGAGWDTSLLHPRNRASAQEMLTNIRLTCVGGGIMQPTIEPKFMTETRALLRLQYGVSSAVEHRVMGFVTDATRRRDFGDINPNQSADDDNVYECGMCGIRLVFLLTTPCGHFLCPECVAPDTTCCLDPSCRALFPRVRAVGTVEDSEPWTAPQDRYELKGEWMNGVDAFANLQPGFELKWRESVQEQETDRVASEYYRRTRAEDATRPRNIASRLDSGDTSDRPTATSASTMPASDFLLAELFAEETKNYTKPSHLVSSVNAILKQYGEELNRRRNPFHARRQSGVLRKPKIVIFSEFRKSLDYVGHNLIIPFGSDAVAQHWGPYRQQELRKFSHGVVNEWVCRQCKERNETTQTSCTRKILTVRMLNRGPLAMPQDAEMRDVYREQIVGDIPGKVYALGQTVWVKMRGDDAAQEAKVHRIRPCRAKRSSQVEEQRECNCFVLLLSKDGAHGLDLSFVTHIFLLDKIWDPAVEQQVVSRAHRMGATGPVVVDQLVMKDTIEDIIDRVEASPSHASASRFPVAATTAAPVPPVRVGASSFNSTPAPFQDETVLADAADAAAMACATLDTTTINGSSSSKPKSAFKMGSLKSLSVNRPALETIAEAPTPPESASGGGGGAAPLNTSTTGTADDGDGDPKSDPDATNAPSATTKTTAGTKGATSAKLQKRMPSKTDFLLRNMRLVRTQSSIPPPGSPVASLHLQPSASSHVTVAPARTVRFHSPSTPTHHRHGLGGHSGASVQAHAFVANATEGSTSVATAAPPSVPPLRHPSTVSSSGVPRSPAAPPPVGATRPRGETHAITLDARGASFNGTGQVPGATATRMGTLLRTASIGSVRTHVSATSAGPSSAAAAIGSVGELEPQRKRVRFT